MKSARRYLGHLEGRPFLLRDLRLALTWAAGRPGVRLHIMLDHPEINEVIEIYPLRFSSPRWLIWNDFDGRLRVVDLVEADFGLPYLTVATALRFIETRL